MEPRQIGHEEYVSRYGSRRGERIRFGDRPRLKDQGSVSAQVGKLTPAEARARVVRRGAPSGEDGVWHALVRELRARGFDVTHTPRAGNTDHVSIRYSNTWDDRVADMFRACFGQPQWHEDFKEVAGD